MRKYFAVILVSLAFTALQGGKLAAYLLCKWQMEVVQQQADCDCEKHLVEDNGQNNPDSIPGKMALKEKPAEHYLPRTISLQHKTAQTTSCFAEYISSLAGGFTASCFHPPSFS